MNAPDPRFIAASRVGIQALPLSHAALQQFDAIIDARTPAEFALDRIPGAINCPVLDDEQRIVVGTLYKSSPFEAKKVGAAMVARNIANFIDRQFNDKPRSWKPLIYCWRGGTRSGAMAHIFRSVGWAALQLDGGYKAWRRQVALDLTVLPAKFNYQVICGRTGSGKSRLLETLAARGAQVIDLEKLAAHKGSVLGDLPDAPQPSQKHFESGIWLALSQFDPTRPVYVEAESRKVGALRVPPPLIERMWQSPCFELQTPRALRLALLRDEYAHLVADKALLFFKLDCLKALHSGETIAQWKAFAEAGEWDAFVGSMLSLHYDPAYDRSMFKNYVHAQGATPVVLDSLTAAGFSDAAQTMPS
jgi:tRNA 2-selenouridine synthase